MMKWFICVCVAYGGFYAPNLYISNRMGKRQSIQRAWPDALDLMLICVEFGIPTRAPSARFPMKSVRSPSSWLKSWF